MVGVACVHAAKLNLAMTTVVVTRPVDLSSIWEDMSKSTLDAKLAVSLETMSMWSAYFHNARDLLHSTHPTYLGKVFARRTICSGIQIMGKRTRFTSLASTLSVELARYMVQI